MFSRFAAIRLSSFFQHLIFWFGFRSKCWSLPFDARSSDCSKQRSSFRAIVAFATLCTEMGFSDILVLVFNCLLLEVLINSLCLEEFEEITGPCLLIFLVLVDEEWSEDELVKSLDIKSASLPVLALLFSLDLILVVIIA